MSALTTLTTFDLPPALDFSPRDQVAFSYGIILGAIMFAVVASIVFRRRALARQAARHAPYTELVQQLEDCVRRMAKLVEHHGDLIRRAVDLREDELTPRRCRHEGASQ
jgi:hypothetical protein